MFVVSLPKHDQSITSLKEQDVEFEPMLTSAYNFLARRDPYAVFLWFHPTIIQGTRDIF